MNWYDGETLAARADAVVVTINYRLSTFGFLYSDEVADVKGNQGLWDQSLALEWVCCKYNKCKYSNCRQWPASFVEIHILSTLASQFR